MTLLSGKMFAIPSTKLVNFFSLHLLQLLPSLFFRARMKFQMNSLTSKEIFLVGEKFYNWNISNVDSYPQEFLCVSSCSLRLLASSDANCRMKLACHGSVARVAWKIEPIKSQVYVSRHLCKVIQNTGVSAFVSRWSVSNYLHQKRFLSLSLTYLHAFQLEDDIRSKDKYFPSRTSWIGSWSFIIRDENSTQTLKSV